MSPYRRRLWVDRVAQVERETGIEPATSCLEGKGSTAELLPPKGQPPTQYISRLPSRVGDLGGAPGPLRLEPPLDVGYNAIRPHRCPPGWPVRRADGRWQERRARFRRRASMDLVFERGAQTDPTGHAILYFRGGVEPAKVYARSEERRVG